MKFKDIDKIKVAISETLEWMEISIFEIYEQESLRNGQVKIIGYQFGAKFKLGLLCKIQFRLLGNIETFEMDKYHKLFPDLVEKIH